MQQRDYSNRQRGIYGLDDDDDQADGPPSQHGQFSQDRKTSLEAAPQGQQVADSSFGPLDDAYTGHDGIDAEAPIWHDEPYKKFSDAFGPWRERHAQRQAAASAGDDIAGFRGGLPEVESLSGTSANTGASRADQRR